MPSLMWIRRSNRPAPVPTLTRKRLLPRSLPLCALALSFAQPAVSQAQRPKPGVQNADALVRKMIAAYQGASSVQDTSEAKVVIDRQQQILQRTSLSYRRPDRLLITGNDPIHGTITQIIDGRNITVYSGLQNVYTKRNLKGSLAQNVTTIYRAVEDLLHISSGSMLDPISFLISKGMPAEATSFRYAGIMKINGHETHKVVSTANTAFVKQLDPEMHIEPVKSEIVLWIDTKNNVLRKAGAIIVFKSNAPGQPKSAPATVNRLYMFEEVHTSTTLNAAIPDSTFAFTPPPGAKQLFQERH